MSVLNVRSVLVGLRLGPRQSGDVGAGGRGELHSRNVRGLLLVREPRGDVRPSKDVKSVSTRPVGKRRN